MSGTIYSLSTRKTKINIYYCCKITPRGQLQGICAWRGFHLPNMERIKFLWMLVLCYWVFRFRDEEIRLGVYSHINKNLKEWNPTKKKVTLFLRKLGSST